MYPNPHPQVVDNEQFGFSFLSGSQKPAERLHRHNEIEIGLSEHGAVDALIGSHRLRIPPGQLVVFWATHPHGPLVVEPGTHSHVVHIPLAAITESAVPIQLVRRLLEGDVILAPSPTHSPLPDLLLVKHWIQLLTEQGERGQRIVLQEAIARLMRLAIEIEDADPTAREFQTESPSKEGSAMTHFTTIIELLSARYDEAWTSETIAKEVGLNPNYMMRLFKDVSGGTLGDWLSQHRIAHAQSMLCTSEMRIEAIASACGFQSLSAFYDTFKRVCRETPSVFRRRLLQA